MNVTIIIHRGNIAKAIDNIMPLAFDGFQKNNISYDILDLSNNYPCNQNNKEAYLDNVIDKLESSSGFLVLAPIIAGGLSATMNSFLEDLALAGAKRKSFLSKKVGSMFLLGGRIGAMQGIFQVVNFFYQTEATMAWARYWPMSWEYNGVEHPENDVEGVETITDIVNQLCWLIKVINTPEINVN